MTVDTQRTGRRGAVLGLVLVVLALAIVAALTIPQLAPLGRSPETPTLNQTYFEKSGVSADVGPLGDSRVGVIGRNRVPERAPGFSSTALVVTGSLAGLLVVIATATALNDRRTRRERWSETLEGRPAALGRVSASSTEPRRKAA